MAALSREEYLKRYLSSSESGKRGDRELPAGRKKRKAKIKAGGMRIVDDDVTWKSLATDENTLEVESGDDDDEAPVIAELIDERPVIIQQMEEFRSSKWKVLGDENADSQGSDLFLQTQTGTSLPGFDSLPGKGMNCGSQLSKKKVGAVSPDQSAARRQRHDSSDVSPVPDRWNDSPDLSPSRRERHDSPDLSPLRKGRHDSPDLSPPRKLRHDSPDLSPPRKKNSEKSIRSSDLSHGKTLSPKRDKDRRARGSPRKAKDSDADLSPPRKGGQHSSDSDLSPPRRKVEIQTSCPSPTQQRQRTHKHASSRGQVVSRDSSPSRKSQGNEMLSGDKAGLVSTDTLRKEKEDRRKRERAAEHLADDARNATTVFRDKLGKKRDLDQERLEQKKKNEENAIKLEKYAQWGKGLAQQEQQRQNIEDAVREMQKPLARHIDDEDLDRHLREKERDGDPMAGLIKKKKEKEAKNKNEKPRYKGPAPPPNRFNLYPGYRWDGVDRSNGFEKKRYARQAEKKAVQEIAYKWSVEDM
ncbi:LOW QUALITY PROTEIN: BUD13 homolog [Leucoraja erinacea]|uniref:LOW QUALITY PROTEIN: BUD13 homolog n=1 Tax=Leucoraja erinaceus TaxID=7782 RepID=UPI002454F37C|nr:LOW QUALITY PROTEIN: BUD13 homolog [Leucoraja erinacea]